MTLRLNGHAVYDTVDYVSNEQKKEWFANEVMKSTHDLDTEREQTWFSNGQRRYDNDPVISLPDLSVDVLSPPLDVLHSTGLSSSSHYP